MNAYEQFETNTDVETKGVELDYGDFQIQVARSGGANQQYNKLLESLTKPHRRAIQTDSISETVMNKIMHELFAKTVVLGWTNMKDRAGKELKFSVENCVQLFVDLPELFTDIKVQAANIALFRKEAVSGEVKNS